MTYSPLRFIFETPLENGAYEASAEGLTPLGERVSLLGCRSNGGGWSREMGNVWFRPLTEASKSFRLMDLFDGSPEEKLKKRG